MSNHGCTVLRGLAVGIASMWCLAAAALCQEPHWPQFRGPLSRGIAGPVEVPDEFGTEKNLVWKLGVPAGVSSPCIWGDRLFLTAYDEDRRALETICVDRHTGKFHWRRDAPELEREVEKVHPASSPANATPVTDGRLVFVYFGTYGLICYDNQGQLVWSRPLEAVDNRWGMGASPILADGRLILACDQGGMMRDGSRSDALSYLMAVDPETGESLWKVDRPRVRSGWSTPIVYHRSEAEPPELVTYSTDRLSAYRLDDGSQLWSIGGLPHDAVATPVVGEGFIFVTGTVFGGDVENPFRLPSHGEMLNQYDANKDRRLERNEVPAESMDPRGRGDRTLTLKHVFDGVDRNKDGVATFFEWTAARVFVAMSGAAGGGGKDGLVAIRVDDGENGLAAEVAWRVDKAIPDNPSPLYYNQRVYLIKSGGILSCIDAQSGKVVKRKRVSASGKVSSSPIVGNGRLYVCSEGGDVVVLDADDQMQQRAQNRLDERIMATPALVGNRLYVRTDSHLFAFGSQESTHP